MPVQWSAGAVVLKPGRERSALLHHPWIFSGAVMRIEGNVEAGDVVDVLDHRGNWLARGWVNPHSQVMVRLLTWDENERIDDAFIINRLKAAWHLRRKLGVTQETDALRIVYSESDGLPGFIADLYSDFIVVQFSIPGIERWRATIVEALCDLIQPHGIYERSEDDTRIRERLNPRVELLYGAVPPDVVIICEHGYKFAVDIKSGQKTGFYLDQRDNRWRSARYLTSGVVLNCFSYTGSFAIYALGAGAERVINVDTSDAVLCLAMQNAQLNGFAGCVENVRGNTFEQLRRYRDERYQFDAIILDPPRFAPTKSVIDKACRGYKDINLLAMKLLKSYGILVTFSCSGLITAELFQKVLFAAASDAGRRVSIVERLSQSRDHPVLLTFPESEYLKGFVCIVE